MSGLFRRFVVAGRSRGFVGRLLVMVRSLEQRYVLIIWRLCLSGAGIFTCWCWVFLRFDLRFDSYGSHEYEWTLRLKVAASLNGMQPSDVRVEFVARRLLPEADLGAPPLSRYAHGEPDGIWRAHWSRWVRIPTARPCSRSMSHRRNAGSLPPRSVFTRGMSFCRIPTSWGS